jgi:hypothetical protein
MTKTLVEQAKQLTGTERTQKIMAAINQIKSNNEQAHQYFLRMTGQNKK